MAIAKRVEVVQPKPPVEIVLTLTEDEAISLKIVCQNIGGSSTTSRRGDMDAIDAALRYADVSSVGYDEVNRQISAGSIFFVDRGASDSTPF